MNSRLNRVLEKLQNMNLTQMIVSDPASIWYLTGVSVEPYERLWAMYINTDGASVLFCNNLFNIPANDCREVWFSDTDNYMSMVSAEIDGTKPLGIDKEWPAKFLIPLMEANPEMRPVLASDCVDDCRGCKDEAEIALMKEASRVNDVVIERAAAYLKEGMTEKELAAFIDAEYLKEGCEGNSFTTIVSYGANAADPHHEPDDTVVQEGDCVLIDMGCKKNRYCSDMTRTFFWKKADPRQIAIHDLVREANERAEAIIKPGVRLCDIDAAARDHITAAGYGPQFNHRLGHFIGQVDHEKGDVSSVNTRTVEPGMIFSIEPGVYLKEDFGVRVEDLVLVTEDGCELLNHVDKNWKVLG